MNNFYVSKIQFVPKPNLDSEQFSEKVLRKCSFCGKKCEITPQNSSILDKLVKTNFHCTFCIRNNFNTKNCHHIFKMSFKSIIEYLYNANYLQTRRIYLCELKDCIEIHQQVGLKNPAFFYDPETFIWFINFNKIGKSPKKIDLDEVFKSVIEILFCFNLYENIPSISLSDLFNNIKDKLEKFYSQRIHEKEIFIPTLLDNFGSIKNKNLILSDLKIKFSKKY